MFRVEGLVKRYGRVTAVDGISFAVEPGEIYGLLGPNGAGKTTTLSMLCGLLRPDEGRIDFDGTDLVADPIRVKAQLGVVPQETAIYEELSARENLRFWGGIYGLSGSRLRRAVDEALDRVGLASRSGDAPRSFSGGMKRRLNLALGLVHSPRAVLLDEPTVGIDPQARLRILDVVRELAAAGTTVVYTTHYLDEAEALCNRIAIMDHGRLLAEGTLDELKRQAGERDVVTITGAFDLDRARSQLARSASARLIAAEPGRLVLSVDASGKGAVKLLSDVFKAGLAVDAVSIRPPSLNGLFLSLTGKELRD